VEGQRMRAMGAADVLALWERGAPRHALDRCVLLAGFARPELPPDAVADLPLGEVTASLLRLREASFGARVAAHADCERCGQRLALMLELPALLQPGAAALDTEAAGLRLRAPSLRDLAAVAHEADAERAARRLLARCTLQGDGGGLSEAALRDAEDALEALDPNADLAFALRCEACGHESTAQLDAGLLLWDDVEARARALFGEVHALAHAYGWSEAEILGLSPARRAAYLAMVGS